MITKVLRHIKEAWMEFWEQLGCDPGVAEEEPIKQCRLIVAKGHPCGLCGYCNPNIQGTTGGSGIDKNK